MGISVPVAWPELSKLTSGAHWTVRRVNDRLRPGNSPWNGYDKSRSVDFQGGENAWLEFSRVASQSRRQRLGGNPPGSIFKSQLVELQESTSALPDGAGIGIEIVDLATTTLVTGLVTTMSANSSSVTAGPLPAGLYEVRAFAGPDIVDVQQLVACASQVPIPPGVHAVRGRARSHWPFFATRAHS
ncbi:MAG: hypothetical protein AB7U97_14420, partial [Pirellulales bacterium]